MTNNEYFGELEDGIEEAKLIIFEGDEIAFVSNDGQITAKLYVIASLNNGKFRCYSEQEINTETIGFAKIIRSGNRNQLTATTAGLVSKANPLTDFNTQTVTSSSVEREIVENSLIERFEISRVFERDLNTIVQWAKGAVSEADAKSSLDRTFGNKNRLSIFEGTLRLNNRIGKDVYFVLLDEKDNKINLSDVRIPYKLRQDNSLTVLQLKNILLGLSSVELFHTGIYLQNGKNKYFLTASIENKNYSVSRVDYTIREKTVIDTCTLKMLDGVIQASRTTYRSNWLYPSIYYPNLKETSEIFSNQESTVSDFRYGTQGIYRPVGQYEWIAERTQSDLPNLRIDGLFNNFHWSSGLKCPDNWVERESIVEYNPYGFTKETTNALEIPSASLYGYGASLNIAYAVNAGYKEIGFEGFEEFENGDVLNTSEQNYFSKLSHGNIDFYTKRGGTVYPGIDERYEPPIFAVQDFTRKGFIINASLNPEIQSYMRAQKLPVSVVLNTGDEKMLFSVSRQKKLNTGALFFEVKDTSQFQRIIKQARRGEIIVKWLPSGTFFPEQVRLVGGGCKCSSTYPFRRGSYG